MIRVSCIGDSVTWGFTLLRPSKQSYLAMLQEKLGLDYEVREIATKLGLELVDLVDLFPDSTYQLEGVHPQATGARMLADAIYNSIKW